MRILDESTMSERVLKNVRGKNYSSAQIGEGYSTNIRYAHMIDYVVFARSIASLMPRRQAIMHFDEWGIWGPSENWFLFDRLCLHFFGATHRLKPMLFDVGELDAAQAILQIGLQHGWGGVYFADDLNWFCFNHDGFAILRTTVEDQGALSGIAGVSIGESKGIAAT